MKTFYKDLVDPMDSSSTVKEVTGDHLVFDKNVYPMSEDGIAIMIPPGGLFTADAILVQTPDRVQRSASKSSFKNYVRRSLLPSLTGDPKYYQRYESLNTDYKPGKVLVIGAGEKVAWYRSVFPGGMVVASDIHILYKPDIVLDAHHIPFPDGYFDMVIAGQVLEHTIRPWVVTAELQRVVATGGIIHIEVPSVFPYHGVPYDFYRFSFSALRTLFPTCGMQSVFITEGVFSAAAVSASNALTELFEKPVLRSAALATGRFMFFWLKYLDALVPKKLSNAISLPKGYGITFKKDGLARTDAAMIDEIKSLLESGKVQ